MANQRPALSFFNELKRRNVFKVSIAYIVMAWLVMQVTDVILNNITAPEWVFRVVLLFLAIGLPFAVFFAWEFELTPEGLKREHEVDRSQSITTQTGRKLDFLIIGALVLALGYFTYDKFVLSVDREAASIEAAVEEASAPADDVLISDKSIAVLPFVNRSRSEDDAFFVDGVHDDLLTQLAKVSALKVISRTSVMRYRDTVKSIPDIGRELGVNTIMEGSVQRAGDRIRITVQLIDAVTDEHLWAESYDRTLTVADIFEIQSEIATAIAGALRTALTDADHKWLGIAPTQNMAALEAYFAGKQLADRRGREAIESAIKQFERAVSLDPDFALAYAGLGYAWLLIPEYSATVDRKLSKDSSKAAIARALELDPELPAGLAFMGWSKMVHEYDWKAAERLLRKALVNQASNSDALHWLSHVLSWQGRHHEAINVARQAVEVDPYSPLMTMNLAYILMDDGRFDESAKYRDIALQLRPNYTELWRNTWLTFMRAGQFENATQALVNWSGDTGRDVAEARQLGRILEHSNKTGEMVQFPAELLANLSIGTENLGQVYAAGGDAESALAELRVALDERAGSRSVLSMKINPLYDFIRDDPRFIELLREANLYP
ncbi:MAG: tetratricopeptide repeat protein [Proteobacteria bacterium]|nr:tetratricopeptide repeat protein [Pseudomonadota bacterium]